MATTAHNTHNNFFLHKKKNTSIVYTYTHNYILIIAYRTDQTDRSASYLSCIYEHALMSVLLMPLCFRFCCIDQISEDLWQTLALFGHGHKNNSHPAP